MSNDITINEDFRPIGYTENGEDGTDVPDISFNGIFEGNNYSIILDSIKFSAFINGNSGEIKNLQLKGNCENPSGGWEFYGFCVKNECTNTYDPLGKLENCKNFVSTTNGRSGICESNLGTIIACENYGDIFNSSISSTCGGISEGGFGGFERCNNFGNITGGTTGGIVGSMSTNINALHSIIDCNNYGNIKGNTAGGICGLGSSIMIKNCKNGSDDKNITIESDNARGYVGGIIGLLKESTSVSECLNFGRIKSLYCAGGIVGQSSSRASITYCHNAGSISPLNITFHGAIVGSRGVNGSWKNYIINCYYIEGTDSWGIGAATANSSVKGKDDWGTSYPSTERTYPIITTINFFDFYQSNTNFIGHKKPTVSEVNLINNEYNLFVDSLTDILNIVVSTTPAATDYEVKLVSNFEGVLFEKADYVYGDKKLPAFDSSNFRVLLDTSKKEFGNIEIRIKDLLFGRPDTVYTYTVMRNVLGSVFYETTDIDIEVYFDYNNTSSPNGYNSYLYEKDDVIGEMSVTEATNGAIITENGSYIDRFKALLQNGNFTLYKSTKVKNGRIQFSNIDIGKYILVCCEGEIEDITNTNNIMVIDNIEFNGSYVKNTVFENKLINNKNSWAFHLGEHNKEDYKSEEIMTWNQRNRNFLDTLPLVSHYPKAIFYYDKEKTLIVDEKSLTSLSGSILGSPKTPIKKGYTCIGWKYISDNSDFSNTDVFDTNIELYPVWQPRDDMEYKVEMYKETEEGYSLFDTKIFNDGVTEKVVTLNLEDDIYQIDGYSISEEDSLITGKVTADEPLVLKVYYDAMDLTVIIDERNGVLPYETVIKFGFKLKIETPLKEGSNFSDWYNKDTNDIFSIETMPIVENGLYLYAGYVLNESESPIIEINGSIGVAKNALVTVKQGNTIFKEDYTDVNGNFSLKGLLEGWYNLVLEYQELLKTPIIHVVEDISNIEVNLRSEAINSVLNVNEGTKDVVVGGLTTIYSNEDLYTEEDKQSVLDGNIVTYSMNVKSVEESEIEERSPDLIIVAREDNKEISGYLKMDLVKYVTTSDGIILSETSLPDLYGHLLEIHVPLREDQQGKEGYIVYRMHDGIVSEITETPNENGAYMTLIDGNNNGKIDELVVYASKFSDYCLAYDKPKYTVTINYDNGLESSVYSVTEDTKIVKPENPIKDGYTFSKWVIKDTDIEFDFNKSIKENLEIIAIYTKNQSSGENSGGSGSSSGGSSGGSSSGINRPFIDIKRTDWYYEDVYKAYDKGLIDGIDKKTFNPNGNMDRASTAHIFYVLNKVKDYKYKDVFNDVIKDTKYMKDILWVNDNNIMIGYGHPWLGSFGPQDSLTREQFALILYRVYKKDTDKYNWSEEMIEESKKVSDWALESMCWAVSKNIIKGNENGDLMPQKAISRAEACTIIIRLLKE